MCSTGQTCGAAGQCGCAPQCTGKSCGDNGCGGTCGTCSASQTCTQGVCVWPKKTYAADVHPVWQRASFLNERHMFFAWVSFISVCSADLYVRLVASGTIRDLRLL